MKIHSSFKTGTIYLTGRIEEEGLGHFQLALDEMHLHVDKENIANDTNNPVLIEICSPGGVASTALAIYDRIKFCNKNSKTKVITNASGQIMSCGFIIWLAGHKRYVFDNTRVMYHAVKSGAPNDLIEQNEIRMNEAKETQKRISEIVMKETGMSKSHHNKIIKSQLDKWFTQEEIEAMVKK